MSCWHAAGEWQGVGTAQVWIDADLTCPRCDWLSRDLTWSSALLSNHTRLRRLSLDLYRPIGTPIVHHHNERKNIIISFIETVNFWIRISYLSHIVIYIFISITRVLLASSKFCIRYFSLRIRIEVYTSGDMDTTTSFTYSISPASAPPYYLL